MKQPNSQRVKKCCISAVHGVPYISVARCWHLSVIVNLYMYLASLAVKLLIFPLFLSLSSLSKISSVQYWSLEGSTLPLSEIK